jgi:hypothetical protein
MIHSNFAAAHISCLPSLSHFTISAFPQFHPTQIPKHHFLTSQPSSTVHEKSQRLLRISPSIHQSPAHFSRTLTCVINLSRFTKPVGIDTTQRLSYCDAPRTAPSRKRISYLNRLPRSAQIAKETMFQIIQLENTSRYELARFSFRLNVQPLTVPQCCSFSRICDHEYDHFVSEIDREGHEDIVLVTPMLDTCPDCTKSMEKSGHKLPADMKESQVEEYRREASRLPTFRMPSKMPADFKDLGRKNTADVKSVSQLPRTSFLPPGAAPRDTYNPSALRVPASGRPSIRPSVAPLHSTRRTDSGSEYPSASVVPQSTRPATAIRDSQLSVRQSVAPSVRPSNRPEASVAPSARPSTRTEASVRPSVKPQASKPPLTAEELLKRGPPRNVAASAFYENPDGDEARANILQQTRKPSQITKMRTEYGGHTAAPRGSEASLDLEKLMGEHSITQSTIPESSRRPEGASRVPSASQRPSKRPTPSRTSGGHSVMPPRESRTPGACSTPRQSHAPSSSQAPVASRAPSASTRSRKREDLTSSL